MEKNRLLTYQRQKERERERILYDLVLKNHFQAHKWFHNYLPFKATKEEGKHKEKNDFKERKGHERRRNLEKEYNPTIKKKEEKRRYYVEEGQKLLEKASNQTKREKTSPCREVTSHWRAECAS
jgi:hypothetical protein